MFNYEVFKVSPSIYNITSYGLGTGNQSDVTKFNSTINVLETTCFAIASCASDTYFGGSMVGNKSLPLYHTPVHQILLSLKGMAKERFALGDYNQTGRGEIFTKEEIRQTFGLSEDNRGPELLQNRLGLDQIHIIDMLEGSFQDYNSGLRPSALPELFAVFTILTMIAIALRSFSRIKVYGKIMGYDWLILVAFVLTVVWGGIAVDQSAKIGKPVCLSSYADIISFRPHFLALDVLYPIALLFTKTSLLWFYKDLTDRVDMQNRILLLVTFIIAVLSTVLNIVVSVLTFTMEFFWRYFELESTVQSLQRETRAERTKAAIAAAALNVGTDWMILMLAIPIILKMGLKFKDRLLVFFAFSVGGLACIASIFRLLALSDFLYPRFDLRVEECTESFDQKLFRAANKLNIWTMVEMNLAIIGCSMPAIRALFRQLKKQYFPHGFLTKSGKSTDSNHSNVMELARGGSPSNESKGSVDGRRDDNYYGKV